MTTEQTKTSSKPAEPSGVQRDSETPTPKKPSVLFLVSTSIGVFTIILLAFLSYNSIAH